ncbi:hypothetical protein LJC55_02285 [Eubacteriales bacterium OttesenSCG-928-N14]|nr:hypothetical protein [Eubacteriales bacterium OttesenSCG-928-N14]
MEANKEKILDYLQGKGPCLYTEIQFGCGLKSFDCTQAIRALYEEDRIMTSGSLDSMSLATKAYIKIWVNEG